MSRKSVPNFTARTLLVMRNDIERMLNTTSRVLTCYNALARENGLEPIDAPVTKRDVG